MHRRLVHLGVQEQNMQCSCAFHPPRCLGVPRIFLTAYPRLPLLASAMAKVSRVCTHENLQQAHRKNARDAGRTSVLTIRSAGLKEVLTTPVKGR